MKTHEQRLQKIQQELEAQQEWQAFVVAIQKPQPAIETFTREALMLLHLILGDKALKS
jgi:hypothetical protein